MFYYKYIFRVYYKDSLKLKYFLKFKIKITIFCISLGSNMMKLKVYDQNWYDLTQIHGQN